MSSSTEVQPSASFPKKCKKFTEGVPAKNSPSWMMALGFLHGEAKVRSVDINLNQEQEPVYQKLSELARTEKATSATFEILSRSHTLPQTSQDFLPFLVESAVLADEPVFRLILNTYPSLLGHMSTIHEQTDRNRLVILMAAIQGGSLDVWKAIVEQDPACMDVQWGGEFHPTVLELVAEQGTPEVMEFLLEKGADRAVLGLSLAVARYRRSRKQEMFDVIKKYWVGDKLPEERFIAEE